MIAIIGVNNFLGSSLALKLTQSGYRVVILLERGQNLPPDLAHSEFVIPRDCDFDNFESLRRALEGSKYVLNCSSYVHTKNLKVKDIHHSIEKVANVVNAALACGPLSFIHYSSVAALCPSSETASRRSLGLDNVLQNKPSYRHLYARLFFEADREVYRAQQEGLPVSVFYLAILLENKKLLSNFVISSAAMFGTRGAVLAITRFSLVFNYVLSRIKGGMIPPQVVCVQRHFGLKFLRCSYPRRPVGVCSILVASFRFIAKKYRYFINSEELFWLRNGHRYHE